MSARSYTEGLVRFQDSTKERTIKIEDFAQKIFFIQIVRLQLKSRNKLKKSGNMKKVPKAFRTAPPSGGLNRAEEGIV